MHNSWVVLWFTSLARPLELWQPTNRAIAALSVAGLFAGVAYGWLSGADLGHTMLDGVSLALTIFFSWALARELDPDGEAAAFVAVAVAVLAWLALGRVDLWALGVGLGACRMVARTVGPPAEFGDALIVFAAVFVLGLVGGRWSLAAAVAIAFLLDALLVDPKRSRLIFAGLAFGVVAAAFAWVGVATVSAPAHPMVLAVVTVVAAVGMFSLPAPVSRSDEGDRPLRRERIVGAGIVALSIVVLAALEPGPVVPASGVIATLLGTTLGRVLPRARERSLRGAQARG